MLIRTNVILGVRHQAKDISLTIAYTCNIQNGAIRVGGILAVCGGAAGIGVEEGDLVFELKSRKGNVWVDLKISFAVSDRAFDEFIQAVCPNTFL